MLQTHNSDLHNVTHFSHATVHDIPILVAAKPLLSPNVPSHKLELTKSMAYRTWKFNSNNHCHQPNQEYVKKFNNNNSGCGM